MVVLRTRLDKATATVPCSGETHSVTFDLGAQAISTQHEEELDEVVAALGGSPHNCRVTINAYYASLAVVDSLLGVKDPQNFKFRRAQGWVDADTCSSCAGRGSNDFMHLLSPGHQGNILGCEPSLVKKFTHWMLRNKAPQYVTLRARLDRLRVALDSAALIEPGISSQYLRSLYKKNLTPEFVDMAVQLLPSPDLRRAVELRNGISIQWGRNVLRQVEPLRLAYVHRHNVNLHRSLVSARNVAPQKVASYMNSGITSHYHTYAYYNAPAEAILEVYHVSNGQTTLAEFLRSGSTIPDALRVVREQYSL